MICPNCQQNLPDDAPFCNLCGTQLATITPNGSDTTATSVEQKVATDTLPPATPDISNQLFFTPTHTGGTTTGIICPNCQRDLPDDALFCNLCGTPLAATTPYWSNSVPTFAEQGAVINTPTHIFESNNQSTFTPLNTDKTTGRSENAPPPNRIQSLLLRFLKPTLVGNAFIGILVGALIPLIIGIPVCWLLLTLAHSIGPSAAKTDITLLINTNTIDYALGINNLQNPFKDTLQLFLSIQGVGSKTIYSSGSETTATFIATAPLNGLLIIPALCLCLGGYLAACTDLTNQAKNSLLRGAAIALPYTILLFILSSFTTGTITYPGDLTNQTMYTLSMDNGNILILGLLWGALFGLLGASLKLARGEWRHMIRHYLRTHMNPRLAGTIIGSIYASGLGIGLSLLTVYGLLAFTTFSQPWLFSNTCMAGDWSTLTTWGIAQGPLYAINLFFFSLGARIIISNPTTCFYNSLPATDLTLRNTDLHLALWVYALLLLPTMFSLFIGGRISTAIAGVHNQSLNALNGALMAIPFTIMMLLLSTLCRITDTLLTTGNISTIPQEAAGVAASDLLLWGLICGAIMGSLGGLYEGSQAKHTGKKLLATLFFLPELISKPLSFLADRLCNVPLTAQRSKPRTLLYHALYASLLLALISVVAGWFMIMVSQIISIQELHLITYSITAILIVLPGLLILSAAAMALLRDPSVDSQQQPPVA